MNTCSICGCVINWAGKCGCGEPRPEVAPDVRLRRKVVDKINKDDNVARKVAKFLGVK